MSFILDALKKVEQNKGRSDASATESIAISGSRFGGRQPVVAMVAIAFGSALLTALAVSFLSGRGEVDPAPTEPHQQTLMSAEGPAGAGSAAVPESEPPESDAAIVGAELATAAPEPVETPPPSAPREVRAPSETAESAGSRASESEPPPEPSIEPSIEPEVLVDEASEDAESQPIRIVGRERALLEGLNIDAEPPSSDDASASLEQEQDDSSEEPLPDDFPDLVLQGTSMIGANAVAVISDQRVFEGDRIQGALVVRIGEREVELELDGRRFTLRL